MNKAKECLELVAGMLVSDTNAVKVESKTDELGVLLTLSVAKTDMGKVIGKQGNIAMALRTIIRAVGMAENAHVNVKIAEPEGYARTQTTGGY